MLCYRDRTFCADKVEKHTCGRELSKNDEERAEKMGLPIAWGSFCAAPKAGQEDAKKV